MTRRCRAGMIQVETDGQDCAVLKTQKALPLVIAYLAFIIIGIASGLLNIAWTFMQPTFGVSLDSLGVLLSAGMVGVLIAAFMSGSLIGKFSIGPVLVGGMVFAGVGLIGYALAPVWIALLAVAFFSSIGKGTIDAGLNNFVSSNYSSSQMNWLHACWGIGLTIAPTVVTVSVLNLGQGWQLSYIFSGLLVLVLGLVILLTLPQWHLKKSKRSQSETARRRMPIRLTVRRPIVLMSILLLFVYGGIEIGTGQLANTLFVEARGISQENSSAWISAYWASFTLGRMLMGLLALRIGDRWLLNASFGLTILGAALLFINISDIFSFVGLLGIGFGLAAVFPILISQTPARVGSEHTANAIGFQVGAAGLGGASLSGAAGAFAENYGIETISLFVLLAALLAAAMYRFIIWWESRQPGAAASSGNM